ATANSKVGNAVLILQQIQLFRDQGIGNFETLLQKVTRDPAMLIWLDNRQNRKGSPNENYAREVQELFTVGIGNYTEQDIHEAARAFTGHSLDRNLQYVFNKNQHDNGSKTFQGQTGRVDHRPTLEHLYVEWLRHSRGAARHLHRPRIPLGSGLPRRDQAAGRLRNRLAQIAERPERRPGRDSSPAAHGSGPAQSARRQRLARWRGVD